MPISLYRAYEPMWNNASSLVLLLLFEAFCQHFTEGLCCNTTTSNKSYHFQLQSRDYQVRLCTQFAHEGLAVDLGSSDLVLEFCSVCLCAALFLLYSGFILLQSLAWSVQGMWWTASHVLLDQKSQRATCRHKYYSAPFVLSQCNLKPSRVL